MPPGMEQRRNRWVQGDEVEGAVKECMFSRSALCSILLCLGRRDGPWEYLFQFNYGVGDPCLSPIRKIEFGIRRLLPKTAQGKNPGIGLPLCGVQVPDLQQYIAIPDAGCACRSALDDTRDQVAALDVARREYGTEAIVGVRVGPVIDGFEIDRVANAVEDHVQASESKKTQRCLKTFHRLLRQRALCKRHVGKLKALGQVNVTCPVFFSDNQAIR